MLHAQTGQRVFKKWASVAAPAQSQSQAEKKDTGAKEEAIVKERTIDHLIANVTEVERHVLME